MDVMGGEEMDGGGEREEGLGGDAAVDAAAAAAGGGGGRMAVALNVSTTALARSPQAGSSPHGHGHGHGHSPTRSPGGLAPALPPASLSAASKLAEALQKLRQIDLILEQLGVLWANTEVRRARTTFTALLPFFSHAPVSPRPRSLCPCPLPLAAKRWCWTC